MEKKNAQCAKSPPERQTHLQVPKNDAYCVLPSNTLSTRFEENAQGK